MAHVLMPLPATGFDPTESAVSWAVLTDLGHRVTVATPDGKVPAADDVMVTGRGLDPWSRVPGLGRLRVVGRVLGADAAARAAYARLQLDPSFRAPARWDELTLDGSDGLLLPGGHRKPGMCTYLESEVLQGLVVEAFARDLPVAAICHGVVLAARSIDPRTGRSVLHGRRSTALTWRFERTGDAIARWTRWWDRTYYRTYVEAPGQERGATSVEHEVRAVLASPDHWCDVAPDDPDLRPKTDGRHRDSLADARPAFVVRDGAYVSARWPGDTHTFAATFAAVLDERATRRTGDEPTG